MKAVYRRFCAFYNIIWIGIRILLRIKIPSMMLLSRYDFLDSNSFANFFIQVIRVVANMSMNPLVGSHLSALDGQLAGLLRILVTGKDGAVLLAALGCLNNLSYYVQAHASLIELTKGFH